jgi:hypothetical protein
VLFGDVNPSGKLPLTFPVNVNDLPANTAAQYPGVNGVATYSEGIFVGYRHFDTAIITPLFPFGFGLSYTSFTYENLVTGAQTVDFDVTNSGSVAGAEVAQVYVGGAGVRRPSKLPGFRTSAATGGISETDATARPDGARTYHVESERVLLLGHQHPCLAAGAAALSVVCRFLLTRYSIAGNLLGLNGVCYCE